MLKGYSRRFFLGAIAAAASGAACAPWLRTLAAKSKRSPGAVKQIILLWLHGGPATIDLWDLKPGHANGGPFREIPTATPGLRISEHLPLLAKRSNDLAVVRSLRSKEGDHGRAVHWTRTGYTPQAGIDFPDLGALIANERASDGSLPGFISINPPQRGAFAGAGFLGPRCSPMHVGEQAKAVRDLVVEDLHPLRQGSAAALPRWDLLQQFDQAFVQQHPQTAARDYQAATQRAILAMQPRAAEAFNLAAETDAVRSRYGMHLFGQGCLLARRLVEHGVSFVEVSLDGWDTHHDNFRRVAAMSQQLDQGFSSLLNELDDRGLLASTLILCQGEFGRTPKINSGAGRDHWPQAWAAVLAGGGVGRGQTIGQTSDDGTEIVSEPYAVPDLIASICHAVGIDPKKQNMSNVDRPIRIADPSARLIPELV